MDVSVQSLLRHFTVLVQWMLGQIIKYRLLPPKLTHTFPPISLMLSSLSEPCYDLLRNLLAKVKNSGEFCVTDFSGSDICSFVFQPCSYGDNGQSRHVNLLASFFGRHGF